MFGKFICINTKAARLLSFMLLILFVSCGKHAAIRGTITNADNQLLELALNSNPKKIIDTLRLNSAGKFSFNYDFKKNASPVFMILSVANKPLASLLLEPGDRAEIETDLKNPKDYKISGSEGSSLLKELNNKTLAISISIDSLINLLGKFENTPEYETEVTKTNREISVFYTKYKRDLIRFIVRHNKSYASYTAIYQKLPGGLDVFNKEADALYFKMLADSLESKYPRSQYVYRLRDDYNRLTQTNLIQNLIENAESSSYPDISLPDVTGKKVTLSSLKGKLVLVDFWSSRDKVTSTNNMELLQIYEKYHSQGFEVYQVSLDESRDSWLYTINNQKLPWINVCDFAGAKTYAVSLYNITKLPANYLISKEGEIVAKDLFGEKLEEQIKLELQK